MTQPMTINGFLSQANAGGFLRGNPLEYLLYQYLDHSIFHSQGSLTVRAYGDFCEIQTYWESAFRNNRLTLVRAKLMPSPVYGDTYLNLSSMCGEEFNLSLNNATMADIYTVFTRPTWSMPNLLAIPGRRIRQRWMTSDFTLRPY